MLELFYLYTTLELILFYSIYSTNICILSSSICIIRIVVTLRMTYPRLKHVALLDI
jgi:hypothetical protein